MLPSDSMGPSSYHPASGQAHLLILTGYTEEELEVRKYIVNIKDEQQVLLVCYHHSTDQMINYRMHTTPEGIVTKVEIEKKVKGKKVWVELKQLTGE